MTRRRRRHRRRRRRCVAAAVAARSTTRTITVTRELHAVILHSILVCHPRPYPHQIL